MVLQLRAKHSGIAAFVCVLKTGRCMKDWHSAKGFCEETFCEVSYRAERLLVRLAGVLQLASCEHTSLLNPAPQYIPVY